MKLKKDSHRQAARRLLTLAILLTAGSASAHSVGIEHVHAGAVAIPSFVIWAGLILGGSVFAAVAIVKKIAGSRAVRRIR